MRRHRTRDVRIHDSPSRVAARAVPAAPSTAAVGSAAAFEATKFFETWGLRRVDVRALADGGLNYSYHLARMPGALLEISFLDGRMSALGLHFADDVRLGEREYAVITALFSSIRPGCLVGEDVLEYIRVSIVDDLTNSLPAPPYVFCDLLVRACTPLGRPIVSLEAPRSRRSE